MQKSWFDREEILGRDPTDEIRIESHLIPFGILTLLYGLSIEDRETSATSQRDRHLLGRCRSLAKEFDLGREDNALVAMIRCSHKREDHHHDREEERGEATEEADLTDQDISEIDISGEASHEEDKKESGQESPRIGEVISNDKISDRREERGGIGV